MAERRMFAKTIIDSDAFLDMPHSSQLLYFHLSMRADDDGFINNPKAIMRNIGCKDDDINLLIMKKFVIPFESGVVVIKHWRIHNYIAKDRYKETKYKEEKESLSLDENNAYTQSMYTDCIQPVSEVYTQDSIGKDSIGKVNKDSGAKKDKKKSMVEDFTEDLELRELIFDFIKMRKDEMKNPMSERAVKLMLTELGKLSSDTGTQKKIVEQSIKKGWNGMFPLKEDKPKQTKEQSVYSSDASYDLDDFKKYYVGSPAWLEREKRKGVDWDAIAKGIE